MKTAYSFNCMLSNSLVIDFFIYKIVIIVFVLFTCAIAHKCHMHL